MNKENCIEEGARVFGTLMERVTSRKGNHGELEALNRLLESCGDLVSWSIDYSGEKPLKRTEVPVRDLTVETLVQTNFELLYEALPPEDRVLLEPYKRVDTADFARCVTLNSYKRTLESP